MCQSVLFGMTIGLGCNGLHSTKCCNIIGRRASHLIEMDLRTRWHCRGGRFGLAADLIRHARESAAFLEPHDLPAYTLPFQRLFSSRIRGKARIVSLNQILSRPLSLSSFRLPLS